MMPDLSTGGSIASLVGLAVSVFANFWQFYKRKLVDREVEGFLISAWHQAQAIARSAERTSAEGGDLTQFSRDVFEQAGHLASGLGKFTVELGFKSPGEMADRHTRTPREDTASEP